MPIEKIDPGYVLFVGGSGRVGRMVLAHLEATVPNADILVQTRSSPLSDVFNNLLWDPLDGPAPLHNWIAVHSSISTIVMLGGATPGADLTLNTTLAQAVMQASIACGVERVLLASSSAVYGLGTDLSETSALNPLNAYGKSKCQMEQVAHDMSADYINLCCLRIGNVAGADALLLNAAQATIQKPLVVDRFSDGNGPLRNYIGPATLADALMQLVQHNDPLPSVLNVGLSPPIDMIQLAHTNGESTILRPALDTAIQHITLDCSEFLNLVDVGTDAEQPHEMIAQWRLLGTY